MNVLLDRIFLAQVGVVLDEVAYQHFSQHYSETLTNRIIDEIITELDEPQAIELSKLRDINDERLKGWIISNVPQLNEIIENEIAILMGEIVENSEDIN